MKKLFLIIGLLMSSECFGAITFHAVATGPNPNGGAFSTTLPTHSDGDFVILECIGGNRTNGSKAYADIAGWTAQVNGLNYAIFTRFWHTGDATTVTCTPNGTGSWETSTIATYSGVNVTTPVDGSGNSCIRISNNNNVSPRVSRMPSLSPSYTNDVLVVFYNYHTASSRSVTLPASLTSRNNNTSGPSIGMADKVLSTASPTGNLDGTWSSEENQGQSGAGLLLVDASPTGATTPTAIPTMACIFEHASTDTANYSDCFPNNNDLVSVFLLGTNTTATVSGFTKSFATGTGSGASTGVGLFTHVYKTGDTTTYTISPAVTFIELVIRNVTNNNTVIVDSSGTNELAASTTATSSSLSLLSTNELYVVVYYAFPNLAFTWTANGTLALDYGSVNNAIQQSQQSPSNPTGTFSATLSAANDAWAGSVAFGLLAPSNPGTSQIY